MNCPINSNFVVFYNWLIFLCFQKIFFKEMVEMRVEGFKCLLKVLPAILRNQHAQVALVFCFWF